MKKRNSILVLGLIGVLSFGALTTSLTSCGSKTEQKTELESVTISNKDQLTAEWRVGEGARYLELKGSPDDASIRQAIADKKLSISTSDSTVVAVNGFYLNIIGEGEATIALTLNGKVQDSVAIKTLGKLQAAGYSVSQVLNFENSKKEAYYVSGKISRMYKDATTPGINGNFYLQDLETEDEILVYGLSANESALTFDETKGEYKFKNDQVFNTDLRTKDLTIGSTITLKCIRTDYKGTKEISGVFQGLHKTVKEILAAENEKSTLYTVSGAIGSWSGKGKSKYGGFNLIDAAGDSLLVYGSTVTTTALSYDSETNLYSYSNAKDFLDNEATKDLEVGSQVIIKVIRDDYGTTKEVNGIILDTVIA